VWVVKELGVLMVIVPIETSRGCHCAVGRAWMLSAMMITTMAVLFAELPKAKEGLIIKSIKFCVSVWRLGSFYGSAISCAFVTVLSNSQ
jgi:hypothetical protein